jgi:BirA family biotin operon repressor/biotin-[acetyl-CoA-carboxylase] ligase
VVAGPDGFDPIRCQLACAARGLRFGKQIEYKTVTDSTNDDALALARAGAASGVVVIADQQRRGRGRRGTSWSSAECSGLLFSLVVRAHWQPAELSVLPLVVGLAVRQVVAARVSEPAFVKWPNDVLVGGRKICGILVESYSHAGEIRAVVIGVGLNVRLEPFAPELAGKAARYCSPTCWRRSISVFAISSSVDSRRPMPNSLASIS